MLGLRRGLSGWHQLAIVGGLGRRICVDFQTSALAQTGTNYFHSTYCLRSRVDVPSTRADQIALGDFSADGEPDVAVTGSDRPELTLLGKRPGVQGYMLPRLLPLGLHPAGHVIAPDLDGDGYDDIVLSLPEAGVVRVFLNATQ